MLTWVILLAIGGFLLGCAAVMTAIMFVTILFGCLEGFTAVSKFFVDFSTKSESRFPGKIASASKSLSGADLSLN